MNFNIPNFEDYYTVISSMLRKNEENVKEEIHNLLKEEKEFLTDEEYEKVFQEELELKLEENREMERLLYTTEDFFKYLINKKNYEL